MLLPSRCTEGVFPHGRKRQLIAIRASCDCSQGQLSATTPVWEEAEAEVLDSLEEDQFKAA